MRILGLIFVCTMLLASRVSERADANSAVVVMAGTATAHDGTQVRAAVETAIRDHGWSVSPGVPTKKELAAVLECKASREPWNCVQVVARPLGVGSVLVVQVDRKSSELGAPMVVVTGQLVVIDSQITAAGMRFCEQCADDRLAIAATELTTELLRDYAVRSGHTAIEVRTTPPGAQVMFDGAAAGVSGRSFNTYPGKHVIVIEHPGFARMIETVTVEEGKTASVVRTLEPRAPAEARPRDERSRMPAAIFIGVGAVLVVGGASYSWTVDAPTSGPQGRNLYSGPAIGVAVVGALAIGVGAFLWPRGRAAPTSSPILALDHGGAIAGWVSRF